MDIDIPFASNWGVPFCCEVFASPGILTTLSTTQPGFITVPVDGQYRFSVTLPYYSDDGPEDPEDPEFAQPVLAARAVVSDFVDGVFIASQSYYYKKNGTIILHGLAPMSAQSNFFVEIDNYSTDYASPMTLDSASHCELNWIGDRVPAEACTSDWPTPDPVSFSIYNYGLGGDPVGGDTVYTDTYVSVGDGFLGGFTLDAADLSAGFPAFNLLVNGSVVLTIDTSLDPTVPQSFDASIGVSTGDVIGFSCTGMGTVAGHVGVSFSGFDLGLTWL